MKAHQRIAANLKRHDEIASMLMSEFGLDRASASKHAFDVVQKRLTLDDVKSTLTRIADAFKSHGHSSPVDMTEAKVAAMVDADRRRQDAFEAKAYRDGLRYSVDAWVHPERGDDRPLTFYFQREPTDAQVVQMLKKRRSSVLNDYSKPRALKNPDEKEGENTMKATSNIADLSNMSPEELIAHLSGLTLTDLVAVCNDLISALNKSGHGLNSVAKSAFSMKSKAVTRIRVLLETLKKDAAEAADGSEGAPADETPEQPEQDTPKPEKRSPKRTVRQASEELILQKDADGKGLLYSDILKRVLVEFPAAKTTVACLRWYANKLREAGKRVPDRSNSMNPQRAVEVAAAKKGK